ADVSNVRAGRVGGRWRGRRGALRLGGQAVHRRQRVAVPARDARAQPSRRAGPGPDMAVRSGAVQTRLRGGEWDWGGADDATGRADLGRLGGCGDTDIAAVRRSDRGEPGVPAAARRSGGAARGAPGCG
ncbi:hypothetical protein LPJ61_006523, partial [Coemansia biformis]